MQKREVKMAKKKINNKKTKAKKPKKRITSLKKAKNTRIKKQKKKITSKTKIKNLLDKMPEAAELLFDAGLFCVGCPMSMNETIGQGCKAHGMKKKEIEELIKKINQKLEQ